MSLPNVVFAIAVMACAAAHVAILISVIRRASGPSSPEVPKPKLAVEIVWALIPAVVLALVLTATWERVRDRQDSPSGVLLEVAR